MLKALTPEEERAEIDLITRTDKWPRYPLLSMKTLYNDGHPTRTGVLFHVQGRLAFRFFRDSNIWDEEPLDESSAEWMTAAELVKVGWISD